MGPVISVPLNDKSGSHFFKPGDDHAWFGHIGGSEIIAFESAVTNPWFSLFVSVEDDKEEEEEYKHKQRLLLKGVSSVTFIRQGGNDKTTDFTFSGIVGSSIIFITGPEIKDAYDPVWNKLKKRPDKDIFTSRIKLDDTSNRYEGILHVNFGLDDVTYRQLILALLKAPGGIIKELQPDPRVKLRVKTVVPLAGIGRLPPEDAEAPADEEIHLKLDPSARCVVRCVSEGSHEAQGNSEPCVKLVGYWEKNEAGEWVFVVTGTTYVPYQETGP